MTKGELGTFLKSHGYHQDKYGHWQKESGGKVYRYKISGISARKEFKADICGKNEWLRIASGYLKNMSVSSDGKLKGLR